jgi:hypothetical protein
MDWLTESRRAYFYRVALALMAVLTVYGVIDADTAPLWLAVVFAVLGLGTSGLAAVNTSTNTEPTNGA